MLPRECLGGTHICVLAETGERFHTCSFYSKTFIRHIGFVCSDVGVCHSVCAVGRRTAFRSLFSPTCGSQGSNQFDRHVHQAPLSYVPSCSPCRPVFLNLSNVLNVTSCCGDPTTKLFLLLPSNRSFATIMNRNVNVCV